MLPSPLEIHEVMKTIPRGEVMTAKEICDVLAKKHKVDKACPYTTGILIEAEEEVCVLGCKKVS